MTTNDLIAQAEQMIQQVDAINERVFSAWSVRCRQCGDNVDLVHAVKVSDDGLEYWLCGECADLCGWLEVHHEETK